MRISDSVDTTWMVQSKCKEVRIDYFFEDENGEWKDYNLAKSTCETCPVRAQCLDYAVFIRDDQGMWGGVAGENRRKLRYKLNKTFDSYIKTYEEDIDFVAWQIKRSSADTVKNTFLQ